MKRKIKELEATVGGLVLRVAGHEEMMESMRMSNADIGRRADRMERQLAAELGRRHREGRRATSALRQVKFALMARRVRCTLGCEPDGVGRGHQLREPWEWSLDSLQRGVQMDGLHWQKEIKASQRECSGATAASHPRLAELAPATRNTSACFRLLVRVKRPCTRDRNDPLDDSGPTA